MTTEPVPIAPTRRAWQWLVPLLALAVVAALVLIPRAGGTADAAAALPARTAAQLLADVAAADVAGLSGTVVQTSRLGLPALPHEPGGGGSPVSLASLLSGSTTARVWVSGEDRQRVAVDGDFAEYDVVRDGRDLWTFDSTSSEVTHVELPAHDGQRGDPAPAPSALSTPTEATEAALQALDPSTEVTVGRAEVVAGRAAYELVLAPRDPGTLVESVRIAVDGETSMPLRVRIHGRGQAEPALEIGFTSVRFTVPDEEVFAFSAPPDAAVAERRLDSESTAETKLGGDPPTAAPVVMPEMIGEGWTSVLVLPTRPPLPGAAADDAEGSETAALLDQLTKPVLGGRVLDSSLLTVLLLDDGRTLVGAVPATTLLAAAAEGAGR